MTVTNTYSAGSPLVSSTATVVGMPIVTLTPANYTDHLKITFAGYNRSDTLSDFPVLVRLSPAVTNFSYSHFASPSGGDLRFTDAGGTRVIPSEIDQWNPAGESTVWVQVPALTTNTTIWAYWGNPDAVTPPAGTNGWVPQPWENLPAFDVVYHLKESGFPFADAAGQFPALNGGIAPTPVAGLICTSEVFSNSFLSAGIINVGNQFTVSAWVNVATNASNIQAIWANKAGGNTPGFAFYVNTYSSTGADDQKLLVETGNGSATPTISSPVGAVSSNAWHFVTAAIDRSVPTAYLYVDGVRLTTTGTVRPDFATNANVELGQYTNNVFGLDGTLDEARIQTGTNSDSWVWASWMTVAQNTGLQSYSAVSSTITNAPTPVTINVSFSGGNLVLSGSGGLSGATYYVIGTTNLTVPIGLWPVLYTNTFDSSGNFNVSLPVDATKPEQFLRIKE